MNTNQLTAVCDKAATPSPYKDYIVTMRFQFPAWDEKDGIPFEETARSKKDAIKYARRSASDAGHSAVGKGRATLVHHYKILDEALTNLEAVQAGKAVQP